MTTTENSAQPSPARIAFGKLAKLNKATITATAAVGIR